MEGVHFDGFWNLAFLEAVLSRLVLASQKLKTTACIEYFLASFCFYLAPFVLFLCESIFFFSFGPPAKETNGQTKTRAKIILFDFNFDVNILCRSYAPLIIHHIL